MTATVNQVSVIDENRRIFEAIASVDMLDLQSEVVTPQDVLSLLNTFKKRGGNIIEMHTNRSIGKLLAFWPTTITVDEEMVERAVAANGDNGRVRDIVSKYVGQELPAIGIRAEIFRDYPDDDMVWQKVLKGEYTGVSIGGAGPAISYDTKHEGVLRKLKSLFEISLVDAAAVPLALLTGLNFLAKGDAIVKRDSEELQKQLIKTDEEIYKGVDALFEQLHARTGISREEFDEAFAVAYPEGHPGEETEQKTDSFKKVSTDFKEHNNNTITEDKPMTEEQIKKEQSVKKADEEEEASEDRSEDVAAADIDAVSSLTKRLDEAMDKIEGRLSAVEKAIAEAANADQASGEVEETTDDAQKQDEEEEAPEAPSEDEEVEKKDLKKVSADSARPAEQIKKAGSAKINALDVARGNINPTYPQIAEALR